MVFFFHWMLILSYKKATGTEEADYVLQIIHWDLAKYKRN